MLSQRSFHAGCCVSCPTRSGPSGRDHHTPNQRKTKRNQSSKFFLKAMRKDHFREHNKGTLFCAGRRSLRICSEPQSRIGSPRHPRGDHHHVWGSNPQQQRKNKVEGQSSHFRTCAGQRMIWVLSSTQGQNFRVQLPRGQFSICQRIGRSVYMPYTFVC